MKKDYLLKNCYIIDVENENHIVDGVIRIKNGKILWIGKSEDVVNSDEIDVTIDLKGLTVLPGFINVHVHLCLSGEPNPNILNQNDIVTTIDVINNSYKTLIEGVTTVRDCGCINSAAIEVSKAIDKNKVIGPRIISTGRALLMTGGHGRFLGREVDGIENLRKAAREEIKAGAKALKVIATGGVLSPGTEIGSPELNYEEILAVVQEAEKRGVTVAAHAIGSKGIMNAINAGVNSIEHGSYLPDNAIDIMKKKNIFHIPTLTAYHRVVENSDSSEIDVSSVKKANQAHEDNLKSFIKSRKAGVKFATGTDAGTPYNHHGNIYKELELMELSGLTKIEALQAATLKSAELLNLEERVGSIVENKIADLIVIEGNPLENLNYVKNIKMVMKEGELIHSSVE